MRYGDLTADWRPQAERVAALGVTLDPSPDTKPHPVDDFIDPGLTRMKPGWDQVDVPEFLQTLGDRAFVALGRIADHGESADVDDELEADPPRLRHALRRLVGAGRGPGHPRPQRRRPARPSARRPRSSADQKPAPAPTRLQHLRAAVARRLGRG